MSQVWFGAGHVIRDRQVLQCAEFTVDFNDSFNRAATEWVCAARKESVLRRASRISINPEGWTSSLKYHVFRVLDVINPGFGLVHASLPAEWTSESPCSERLTTRDFSRTRRVKDHAPAGLLVTGSCVTAPWFRHPSNNCAVCKPDGFGHCASATGQFLVLRD